MKLLIVGLFGGRGADVLPSRGAAGQPGISPGRSQPTGAGFATAGDQLSGPVEDLVFELTNQPGGSGVLAPLN